MTIAKVIFLLLAGTKAPSEVYADNALAGMRREVRRNGEAVDNLIAQLMRTYRDD